MVVLYILATIYLFIGLAYAVFIMLNGIDKWYFFPINLLFGPITLVYNYYKFIIKKELPR